MARTYEPWEIATLEHYVAFDVPLREISVCVMDGKGAVLFEGMLAGDPEILVTLSRATRPRWFGSV